MTKRKLIYIILILPVFVACSRLREIVLPSSPREQYIAELSRVEGSGKALAAAWDSLGKASLNDSLFVSLPHTESFYSNGKDISSHSIRFSVPKGRKMKITIEGEAAIRVFADLYAVDGSVAEKPILAVRSDKDSVLEYTAAATSDLLLRIQSEVNAKGFYNVRVSSDPSIAFPVSNKDIKAVGSFWGDSRDGGKRKHQEVDIFAPKGTPLLAVCDGYITNTGNTRLGGKVVWLASKDFKYNYYYAHLDSQMVSRGKFVKKGDIIGTVGNTGNARTTPPHLHFGIYERGGATDPYSFIDDSQKRYPGPKIDPTWLDQVAKVKGKKKRVDMLRSCDQKGASICSLTFNDDLKVIGVSGDFIRVATTAGRKGYVPKKSLQLVKTGTGKRS